MLLLCHQDRKLLVFELFVVVSREKSNLKVSQWNSYGSSHKDCRYCRRYSVNAYCLCKGSAVPIPLSWNVHYSWRYIFWENLLNMYINYNIINTLFSKVYSRNFVLSNIGFYLQQWKTTFQLLTTCVPIIHSTTKFARIAFFCHHAKFCLNFQYTLNTFLTKVYKITVSF